jgi:hypothetical protein
MGKSEADGGFGEILAVLRGFIEVWSRRWKSRGATRRSEILHCDEDMRQTRRCTHNVQK